MDAPANAVEDALVVPRTFFVDPTITGGDGATWETALAEIPPSTPGVYYVREGAFRGPETLIDVELRGGQAASLTGTNVDPAPTGSAELDTGGDALRLEGRVALQDVHLRPTYLAIDGDLRLDRVRLDARLVLQASSLGTITGDDVTVTDALSGDWGTADLTRVHGTFGGQQLQLMRSPGAWHCRANACSTATTVGFNSGAPQVTNHMVGTIIAVTAPGVTACFRRAGNAYTSLILVGNEPTGPWTVVASTADDRRACHVIGNDPYVAFAFYRSGGATERWDTGPSGETVPGLGTTAGLFVADIASSGTVLPLATVEDRIIYETIDVLFGESAP